jgi:hypothetical protein
MVISARYPQEGDMSAIRRTLAGALAALLLNVSACGFLIYPERQGLRTHRVDATVVLLDAVGLLLYIVPGVVAFAVDFATGCIYLPEHHEGVFSQRESAPTGWVEVARVAPYADDAAIAMALQRYLRGPAARHDHNGDLPAGEKSGVIRWLDRADALAAIHSGGTVVAAAERRTGAG